MLRSGGRRQSSARSIGITHTTVNAHYKSDPDFRAAVEAAEMEANEAVENALYDAAVGGNVVAMQVWLYNRMPKRWMNKARENKEPIPVQEPTFDMSKLTDAELITLRDLSKKINTNGKDGGDGEPKITIQ